MDEKKRITSVALSYSNRTSVSRSELEDTVDQVSKLISDGGYLFILSEYRKSFQPGISIESSILRKLMHSPDKREDSWLFFGNGAIRGYSDVTKKHSSTWQWLILQKAGERTLSRRKVSTKKTLNSVALPVSHYAFTRDVANNVWHLPESSVLPNAINRLGNLLSWPGDIILYSQNGKSPKKIEIKKMDLTNDLIGVAQKKIYTWQNEDTLF